MAPLVVEQSRVIPAVIEAAFDRTLSVSLPALMSRWYGPIPPIKAVREQTGSWDTAGRSRLLVLAGGGSARELLTSVKRPRSFGYTLSEIKGPLALLVSSVDGEWAFTAPAGASAGTTVTWRWSIHPRSPLTAPLLPVFARLWKGNARRVLERLAGLLAG